MRFDDPLFSMASLRSSQQRMPDQRQPLTRGTHQAVTPRLITVFLDAKHQSVCVHRQSRQKAYQTRACTELAAFMMQVVATLDHRMDWTGTR